MNHSLAPGLPDVELSMHVKLCIKPIFLRCVFENIMKVVADSSLLNVPKDVEILYYQGFHVYDITGTKLTTRRSPCPQILSLSVSRDHWGSAFDKWLCIRGTIREAKSKGAINKRVVRRCQHYHNISMLRQVVYNFTQSQSLSFSTERRERGGGSLSNFSTIHIEVPPEMKVWQTAPTTSAVCWELWFKFWDKTEAPGRIYS